MLGSAVKRRRPTLRFAVEVASAIAAVASCSGHCSPQSDALKNGRERSQWPSGSLRTLNTAAASYSDTYGHYPPSLKSFGPSPSGIASEDGAGLIDNTLARGGPKIRLPVHLSEDVWRRTVMLEGAIRSMPMHSNLAKVASGIFLRIKPAQFSLTGVDLGGA